MREKREKEKSANGTTHPSLSQPRATPQEKWPKKTRAEGPAYHPVDNPASRNYVTPLQGWSLFGPFPRALPWAGMSRPFRAAIDFVASLVGYFVESER
jgi:hypothetical protein